MCRGLSLLQGWQRVWSLLSPGQTVELRALPQQPVRNKGEALRALIVKTNQVDVDQVKGLKPAEVRQALCDAGLSPVGDKNELLKVRM